MKVKELIERLQESNPEHDVVLSADPEGNGYSKAHSTAELWFHEREVYSDEDLESKYAPHRCGCEEVFVIWPE